MAVLEKGIWNEQKEVADLTLEDSFKHNIESTAGRYHLYMSYACPFAHRPLLVINYLGLNDAITFSSVAAKRYSEGWLFDDQNPDPIYEQQNLAALYLRAKADYTGRVTVPILWDKLNNTIASNDSSNLAMELATNWLSMATNKVELVPSYLKDDIERLNSWLHQNVNRKVYHVGFAKSQHEYDSASDTLFNALTKLDETLSKSTYLHGSVITLSDLFLLPTLVRFEAVYEVHFKANKKPLKAFTHLYRYMLDLLNVESIRATIEIEHMKEHYYFSHAHINPHRIIPAGPEITW
jgi:putative glutathione S-transferase